MYICLCKAVTDHDIEAAVAAGARTMHEVQRTLAVSTGCGACASAAQIVIDQTLAKTRQATGDANASGLRLQDLTKSDITALVYAV
jgi:bacterioferritin-associated ferredoxin